MVASRLGVGEAWQWNWERLSHGERKRAQIAAALYKNPPVLVLDEPTNHLDYVSKALLVESLQRYRGIGILISHDRELLDGLCRHTLFLGRGSPDMRHSAYSVAKREREKEIAYQRELHERHGKTVKKLKRQVQAQRQKADRSDARVSKRHVDPKDVDTKKKLELAVFTGKDATDGKILERYKSRLAQAEAKRGRGLALPGRTGAARAVFCATCWRHRHGPTGCFTFPRRSPKRNREN